MSVRTVGLAFDPSGAVSGAAQYRQAGLGVVGTNDKIEGSAERAREELGRFVRAGNQGMPQVAKQARATGKEFDDVARNAKQMGAAFSAAFGVRTALTTFLEFDRALAETSTLLSGVDGELARIRETSRDFVTLYGGSATNQVKAYYQAISAGAGGAAEAQRILDTANKLAVGGVTDMVTSVDALTTAMNAYKSTGLTAARTADILFTGIKAGKTTASELGATLGNVVPIASGLGISFSELTASIAALTTQGLSTASSVTGVRAVLTAVAKPTKEAADLAKELGLEYDTTALASQGLAGFLDNVAEATNGNKEQMAQLFGSVEALNAVLAFSGGAGQQFDTILGQMENSTGAADEAFKKMSESLSQRWNVALATAKAEGEEYGELMAKGLVPAFELVVENMDLLTAAAVGFGAVKLAPMLASVTVQAYAMTTSTLALNAGLGATAIAANAARAALLGLTGPIGLGLAAAGAALYLMRERTDEVRDATDSLKEMVGGLEKAYQGAGDQAKRIADISKELSLTEAVKNARVLQEKFESSRESAVGFTRALSQQQGASIIGVFGRELGELVQKAETGEISIKAFRKSVDDLRRANPSLQSVAESLLEATKETESLERQARTAAAVVSLVDEKSRSATVGLRGFADAAGDTGLQLSALSPAAQFASEALEDYLQSAHLNKLGDRDRALEREGIRFKELVSELEEAGASQEALNQARAAYQSNLNVINVDFAQRAAEKERQAVERIAKERSRAAEEVKRQREQELAEAKSFLDQLTVAHFNATEDRIGLAQHEHQKQLDRINELALSEQDKQSSRLMATAVFEKQKTDILLAEQKRRQQASVALSQLDQTLGGSDSGVAQIWGDKASQIEVVKTALEERVLTEQSAMERIVAINEHAAERLRDLEQRRQSEAIQSAETTFGNLANIVKGFSGEQSAAYKALFAVSKGFAIADSLLKIQQAAAQVMANPTSLTPAQKLAEYGIIAAQGASIVSNIAAVSGEGFRKGGHTGYGNPADIAGPVHKEEFVLHQRATREYRPIAEAMNRGDFNPNGGGVVVKSTVINQAPGVVVDESKDSNGNITYLIRKELDERLPGAMAKELGDSYSPASRAIMGTFGVNKKAS